MQDLCCQRCRPAPAVSACLHPCSHEGAGGVRSPDRRTLSSARALPRTQASWDKSLCQPAGAAWTRLERGAGRQRERPLQRGRERERLAERGRVAAAHAHGRLAQGQARRDDQRQLGRADARAGRVLGRRV